mmetsp:Transcript_66949/g.173291  ORF Transcript_66949/g.173291 Transcript_66949/m.173291 type:complete len:189 (-) Transcript_66949:83-649(-)
MAASPPRMMRSSASEPRLAATSSSMGSTTRPVENHELHLSGIRTFTGIVDDPRTVMSTHPMSETRKGCALVEGGMKDVWRLRKAGNFVMNNSRSLTFLPEAATEQSNEFQSYHTLTGNVRRHTRSPCSPVHKYHRDKVASHAIGWHAEDDHILSQPRKSHHGLEESKVTKRYVDMKATGAEAFLRICK